MLKVLRLKLHRHCDKNTKGGGVLILEPQQSCDMSPSAYLTLVTVLEAVSIAQRLVFAKKLNVSMRMTLVTLLGDVLSLLPPTITGKSKHLGGLCPSRGSHFFLPSAEANAR